MSNEKVERNDISFGKYQYEGVNESFNRYVIFMRKGWFKYQDLYYDTPEFNKDIHRNSFEKCYLLSHTAYHLGTLLRYFGFNDALTRNDLIDLKQNLFNGVFPYENYKEFGYEKVPKLMWKNGVYIGNLTTAYEYDNYELVMKNSISHYFPLLCKVDYQDPESIFRPNEEIEGPIRKRILGGYNG